MSRVLVVDVTLFGVEFVLVDVYDVFVFAFVFLLDDMESFCMLFTTDSSQSNTTRLKALTQTNDGFKLADLDLELRGSGEIFGNKQTGLIKLKIAKLSEVNLIKKAQKWAKEILTDKKYINNQDLQDTIVSLKNDTHLE